MNRKLVGKKKFDEEVDEIIFNNQDTLFMAVVGRYLYIYELPKTTENIMVEPFMLLKKINVKVNKSIYKVKFSEDGRYIIYVSDKSLIRIMPLFPYE